MIPCDCNALHYPELLVCFAHLYHVCWFVWRRRSRGARGVWLAVLIKWKRCCHVHVHWWCHSLATLRGQSGWSGSFYYAGGRCASLCICAPCVSRCVYVTKACWSVTWSCFRGVTADLTLGLIPSIHLQRHCQSVNATSSKRRGGGIPEQRWIGKDGRKERGKGDRGGGGGNRKRAEWKEFTVEGEEYPQHFPVASPVKSVSLSSKHCVFHCVVV